MTFATDDATKQSLEAFNHFDVNTKLALLWFGYEDLKDKLNPANAASAQDTAGAAFNEIQAMPHEQQLQAMQDIASKADNSISHSYRSLSSSGKLDLWHRLAQGMENGSIIPMPSNYELPQETQDFTNQIKNLDFEQRLNFMRSVVIDMGAAATT